MRSTVAIDETDLLLCKKYADHVFISKSSSWKFFVLEEQVSLLSSAQIYPVFKIAVRLYKF